MLLLLVMLGCWRRQIGVDGVWMCGMKIRYDG